ncbi:hypothetical protein [Catenuloplanes indicus]|uniref:Uncharacterized protein n=1 Tax=Catenuloplanes indicus TaxID=137267 RepID=A0AAE4AVS2_9ACTN|nr:hypothetical protein [Catenuloplanes indicus]MDQ0364279.1 hypothetical protein [Catenuloplanes indicus]
MGATAQRPAVPGTPEEIEFAPQTADTQLQTLPEWYALSHSVVHGGTVETRSRSSGRCRLPATLVVSGPVRSTVQVPPSVPNGRAPARQDRPANWLMPLCEKVAMYPPAACTFSAAAAYGEDTPVLHQPAEDLARRAERAGALDREQRLPHVVPDGQ